MTIVPKRIFVSFISLLLVGFLFAVPSTTIKAQSTTETMAEINDYVTQYMKANHISGVSLAISKGQNVFYTQGYGTYSDGRKITTQTPFPIASLSKSMTALAVLQLADKGLINLDAPYTSYFPDISPMDDRVNQITIRHLLNQTSGLNDQVNPDMTKSVQFRSLAEIKKSLTSVKLATHPGEQYNYHNPNYQFLALLVEQVSKQRFSDYLHDHIFTPLGMKNTFSIPTTAQFKHITAIPQGHYLLFGKPMRTAEPFWFIEGAAGVISTADDMAKWMRAQYNAKLLSPRFMKQYHAAGQEAPYGMGWNVSEDTHGKTISHTGIFWTYKAEETIFLEKQLGISIMFDTGINAFVDYSTLLTGVVQIVQGGNAETSFVNSRNMENIIIVLMGGTVFWGGYSFYRRKKNKRKTNYWKLSMASTATLFPLLILIFLPSILPLIAGGRVVPWNGIWMMMPSLIIWLTLLSLVNMVNLIHLCYVYDRNRRNLMQ